jgi:RNA polymerase-interacting CarD/CdnL/TRCF family regulator
MTEKKVVFKEGDWLVHGYYGVGKIIKTEETGFEGKSEVFYRIRGDGKSFMLSSNDFEREYIRTLVDKKILKKALSALKTKPQALPSKPSKVKQMILKTVEDGSLLSNAQLIRDLNAKNKKAKLDQFEKNWLLIMQDQLEKEWSLVSEKPKEKISEELEEILK